MKKLLAIARHEIRLRYMDPTVWLFNIAMPLLIAALVHLAFGNVVLGRTIPEKQAPVGIVNQDRGSAWGNFGRLFVRAMIPGPSRPSFLAHLPLRPFAVREIADETQARRLVEREELAAALLIPADFSEALAEERAVIEVYVNGNESIVGDAFTSVVEVLANMISSGEVAVRTAVHGLLSHPRTRVELQLGKLDDAMADLALAAALPESNPIQIERIPAIAPPAQIQLAHYLAATIAIMFVSLGALMVSANLFHDLAQWTLQRMYLTPTRPAVILGGKILGTYLAGLIQMVVLIGGLAALERALGSDGDTGPGIDLPGLMMLALALAAAATGFGVAIAGLAGTSVQTANYGRALLMVMGAAGGIFFPVDLFPSPFDLLSRLTFQYWASAGYIKLALGGSAASILPHTLILTAMGVLFFAVGSRLLRRRIGFL